jgi:hypothetical protein
MTNGDVVYVVKEVRDAGVRSFVVRSASMLDKNSCAFKVQFLDGTVEWCLFYDNVVWKTREEADTEILRRQGIRRPERAQSSPAKADAPGSQPHRTAAHFIRRIRATATKGTALGEVAEVEVGEAAQVVQQHLSVAPPLTVEQEVDWAALYLFVVARCVRLELAPPLPPRPLTSREVQALKSAMRVWTTGGVAEADRALQWLLDGPLSQPGAVQGSRPNPDRWTVTAEVLPSILGNHRLHVTLDAAADEAVSEAVDFELRAMGSGECTVVVSQAIGAGLKGSRIAVPVDGDGCEILFVLRGPRTENVAVELTSPVAFGWALRLDGLFATAGGQPPLVEPAPQGVADDGMRRALDHILKHGSASEAELITMLGSPRAARRFAANLEYLLKDSPFIVRVECTADGKRYIRSSA